MLLWLWRRPVAIALIRLLAWETPYAVGVAQEMAKRQKQKKTKQTKQQQQQKKPPSTVFHRETEELTISY